MADELQEFEGRSAAEAAIKACEALGLTRSTIKYDVVSEEGEGLDRRVVISVQNAAASSTPAQSEAAAAPSEDPGPRREAEDASGITLTSHEQDEAQASSDRGRRSRGGRGRDRDRDRERGRGGRRSGGRGGRDRGRDGGNGGDQPIESYLGLDALPDEMPEPQPEVSGAVSPKAQLAKDALGELLKHMGMALTAHLVRDDEEEIHLDIRGEDATKAIGEQGDGLLALQVILNRIVGRQDDGEQVLVLDAAAYRERRKSALEKLAQTLADRACEKGKVVRLSPMSAHDRRIFHLSLQERDGVSTRSEGEGLYRRLMIVPEARD